MTKTRQITTNIEMTVAREGGEWLAEDGRLEVPAVFAAWLDGNVCQKCPHGLAFEVCIVIDDEFSHQIDRVTLRGKALPTAMAVEISTAWESWLEREVRDAVINAVCL